MEPFIYQAVRSDGTAIPAAVSLEGTRFFRGERRHHGPALPGGGERISRKEAAVEMIRYLFP